MTNVPDRDGSWQSNLPYIPVLPNISIALPSIADNDLPGCPMILVVDDEPGIRQVICRMIHDNNYIAISTDTAETALELISQFGDRIGVLITDIHLKPGKMDGLHLCRQARDLCPTLGVLAMSGSLTAPMIEDLDRLKVRMFCKPFDMETMLAVLKSMIAEAPIPTY